MNSIEWLMNKQAGSIDRALGTLTGILERPVFDPAFLRLAAIPTAAGAGIGALRHVVHGNEDRSMWDDVKSGMIAGGVIGGVRAAHSLLGIGGLVQAPKLMMNDRIGPALFGGNAISSMFISPTVQMAAGGVLADQLVTNGEHPWLGGMAGALGGMYLTHRAFKDVGRPWSPASKENSFQSGHLDALFVPIEETFGRDMFSPPDKMRVKETMNALDRIRLATGI